MAGNNRDRARSRALKEEGLVNFKSFQDSQISALSSIASALENTTQLTVSVKDSLSSIQSAMESMTKTTRNLEAEKIQFEGQINRRRLDLENRIGEARMKNLQAEEEAIKDALNSLKNATNESDFERARQSLENSIQAQDMAVGAQNDAIESLEGNKVKISKVVGMVVNKLMDLAKAVAGTANTFSKSSNDMIQVTGASGSSVRSTRSEIVHDIIGQLNSETGNLFNPTASYQKMIDIASQADVGNLEAIEEMTRTILLSSETTNLDNSQLARLLNKWYSRYNFSSIEMEGMLDDIRGYTAGNNASALAVQENIDLLNSWMEYYAGGDSEKLSQWTESITKGSAWLESMNVDTNRYTEYIKELLTGSALGDENLITLSNFSDYGVEELQRMAQAGDYEELYRTLFEAESKMFKDTISDTDIKAQVAEVWGQDVDQLVDSYNAMYNNKNFQSLEEFVASAQDSQTAIESADDKFMTWSDSIENYLSGIWEHVAGWQEKLGVALSDILSVLGGIGTAVGAFFGGKAVGGLLGGTTLSSLFGGTAATGAATGGTAAAGTAGISSILLPVGAAVSGVVGVGDSVYDISQGEYWEGGGQLGAIGAGTGLGFAIGGPPGALIGLIVSSIGSVLMGEFGLGDYLEGEWNKFKHNWGEFTELVENWWNIAWGNFQNGFDILWSDISQTWINFWNDIRTGWEDFWSGPVDVVNNLLDSVKGYIDGIDESLGSIKDFGSNAVDSVKGGFNSFVDSVSNGYDYAKTFGMQGLAYVKGLNEVLLPGHADGLDYVPYDNYVARVHEGETIVPKKYNPAANVTELEMLRKYYKDTSNQETNETAEAMREMKATLVEIREFLSYWRDDNIQRESISRRRTTNNFASYISQYMPG